MVTATVYPDYEVSRCQITKHITLATSRDSNQHNQDQAGLGWLLGHCRCGMIWIIGAWERVRRMIWSEDYLCFPSPECIYLPTQLRVWGSPGTCYRHLHCWDLISQSYDIRANTEQITTRLRDISKFCSHCSNSYITALSLVESFIVMLRQLCYSMWLPCTERIYYGRPDAIKTKPGYISSLTLNILVSFCFVVDFNLMRQIFVFIKWCPNLSGNI